MSILPQQHPLFLQHTRWRRRSGPALVGDLATLC